MKESEEADEEILVKSITFMNSLYRSFSFENFNKRVSCEERLFYADNEYSNLGANLAEDKEIFDKKFQGGRSYSEDCKECLGNEESLYQPVLVPQNTLENISTRESHLPLQDSRNQTNSISNKFLQRRQFLNQNVKDYERILKLMVLGEERVGKSLFISKCENDQFSDNTSPTSRYITI